MEDAIFVKWTGEVSAAVVMRGSVYTGSRGFAGGLPPHTLRTHGVEFGRPEPHGEPLSVAVGIRRLAEKIGGRLRLRLPAEDELLRDYFRSRSSSIAPR